jgi:hypothetical protein
VIRAKDRKAAMDYLMGLDGNVVLQLAHEKVPLDLAEKLTDLGLTYDYLGNQSKYRLTTFGRDYVAEVIGVRGLVGYTARVVTDDERLERKVRAIAQRKDDRIQELKELRARHEAGRRAAAAELGRQYMLTVRPLESLDCVTCGSEIEYKRLNIYDRRRKYECMICGIRVKPKRVPGEKGWAGRLPTIHITNGMCATVCYDCVKYCSSCWTKGTYRHIMKVYGVDLRDG